MPRYVAAIELPVTRDAVWELLSDPGTWARWWPGLAGADDRGRGLAPGARWHLEGAHRPRFIRSPEPTGELFFLRAERPSLIAWQLTGDRLDAELRLEERDTGSTEAVLVVEGPHLIGLRRSLPSKALSRLKNLCTATSGE